MYNNNNWPRILSSVTVTLHMHIGGEKKQETLLKTTEKNHNSQHSNQEKEKLKQGLHIPRMIEYRNMHLYVSLLYSRHFFGGSLHRRHFAASLYPETKMSKILNRLKVPKMNNEKS